jgi:diguanylate cyclase (GGDEF)-like protein
MQLFLPMFAALPGVLTGVLSVVAATAISFAVILLVSSFYRFQHIVKMAEDKDPDEMGVATTDVLRVHLARYLAGGARQGRSFSLSLIQINNPSVEVGVNSPILQSIKGAVRTDDVSCVYSENAVALVMEIEPDDTASTVARVLNRIALDCPDISKDALRVGVSSYPGHGLAGNQLIKVAAEALEQTQADQPIFIPEIIEVDEDDDEADDVADETDGTVDETDGVADETGDVEPVHDEAVAPDDDTDAPDDERADEEEDGRDGKDEDEDAQGKSWASRRRTAMLDELTGVLKPSAVSSYMQRMMNDIRQKRKKSALFCIGVNNMDHIARVHGEEAVDAVLVGVSKVLQDHLRSTDLIGRHERFAFLILAQISLEDAEIIGKRISTVVQQSAFTSAGKKIKTTISLGVAAYPEHGRNLHLLYKAGQKVLDYNRLNDIRAYAVYDPAIHDSVPSKPMRSIKSL